MEDQLGTKQIKVGHGHANNYCEWTTCPFFIFRWFSSVICRDRREVFCVLEASMGRFASQYELGQKIEISLLLKKFW